MTDTAFTLRDYRPADAELLRDVYRAAILQTARAAYTDEQLQAWVKRSSDAAAFAALCGAGWMRVACDRTGIIGFAQINRPGHIAMMFTAPHAGRRGVAGALLRDLLCLARDMGSACVTTEASRIARPFFAKHGFAEVRQEVVQIDGQQLERFCMAMQLNSA